MGNYIAHIRKADRSEQSVCTHNEQTAKLASDMAIPKFQQICYSIGILHDIGKYQPSFQKRIRGDWVKVEHSIAGAKYLQEKYRGNRKWSVLLLLMELCIAGHHSGLPDCGLATDTENDTTLFGRLKRSSEDYSIFSREQPVETVTEDDVNTLINLLRNDCNTKEEPLERFSFFTKYCFSCLTDADSLDTEAFMENKTRKPLTADFEQCLTKINQCLSSFTCQTELQKARGRLQSQVYSQTNTDSDIYLLSMPTGSGKTLCSMKFALERLLKSNGRIKRIIYIIPYNSIIDQTAKTFEKLFGDSVQILRHQSTFSYEEKKDSKDEEVCYRLATENWDAQLIITTSVQFFESVFGNKRSKLRKLHNMADSILVFDEAHFMPVDFLVPCLRAIGYLTKYLNSEAVFLTATMPDYRPLLRQYVGQSLRITDLITDTKDFRLFDKCRYENIGCVSDDAVIERAAEYASSLIVANTRNGARQLYKIAQGRKYHLSTYMTAKDRAEIIETIRRDLSDLENKYPNGNVPAEERITVVSTSLIEAGVDLDFHTAFRELAGLDNLLQTGGRCNREGKRQNAATFVFERSESAASNIRKEVTKGIMTDFTDFTSDAAIKEYYRRLFDTDKDRLSQHCLQSRDERRQDTYCKNIGSIPFASQSSNANIIDSVTESVVIVQDDESSKLVETLRCIGKVNFRKLQKYCASIYPSELQLLIEQNAVKVYNGVYVLENADYYDREIGLKTEGKDIYY